MDVGRVKPYISFSRIPGLRVRMGVSTGSISDGRPVMSSTVMSLAKGERGDRLQN